MIRYASIIEDESLKVEIIMCPAGAYYENHLINKKHVSFKKIESVFLKKTLS